MSKFSGEQIVMIVLLTVVFTPAIVAFMMLPGSLRKWGILTGPPLLNFGRIMLLRAIAVAGLVYCLSVYEPRGQVTDRVADSTQAALLITIVVIVTDALWDTVSRIVSWWRG